MSRNSVNSSRNLLVWGMLLFIMVGFAGISATVVRVSLAAVILVLDRKSTRLNSSHLGISYAVFCLKKKRDKNHEYGEPMLTRGEPQRLALRRLYPGQGS